MGSKTTAANFAEVLSDVPHEQLRDAIAQLVEAEINRQSNSLSAVEFALGEPSKSDLSAIASFVGHEVQGDDWFMVSFHASDNLINRSWRRWHQNVLRQMADYYPGCPLIVDHNWAEVEDAVGFITAANLVTDPNPSNDYFKRPDPDENRLNRKIVKAEGLTVLYLTAAIPRSLSEVVQGVEFRRLHCCSTGGLLSNIRMICPNCSEKHGREVTFTERDKQGEYVCPHEIPWMGSRLFADESESSIEQADYLWLDGTKDVVELSFCQTGNLPLAGVMRGGGQ